MLGLFLSLTLVCERSRLFFRRQIAEAPQSRVGLMVPSRKSVSQQHRFQFDERSQKLIRFHDKLAAIAAMRVNDVTPSVASHYAAMTPRVSSGAEPISDDLPVFHSITVYHAFA